MFRRRSRFVRRGFTLIEAAITTVIVGVGFTASMELFYACTRSTVTSGQLTVATMLAANVQEALTGLSFSDPTSLVPLFGPEAGETAATYDDIDDFDLHTFSPPIDASLTPLSDLSQYAQIVTVAPVPLNRLSTASGVVTKTTNTGALRVTVVVTYRVTPAAQPAELQRLSWVQFNQ